MAGWLANPKHLCFRLPHVHMAHSFVGGFWGVKLRSACWPAHTFFTDAAASSCYPLWLSFRPGLYSPKVSLTIVMTSPGILRTRGPQLHHLGDPGPVRKRRKEGEAKGSLSYKHFSTAGLTPGSPELRPPLRRSGLWLITRTDGLIQYIGLHSRSQNS